MKKLLFVTLLCPTLASATPAGPAIYQANKAREVQAIVLNSGIENDKQDQIFVAINPASRCRLLGTSKKVPYTAKGLFDSTVQKVMVQGKEGFVWEIVVTKEGCENRSVRPLKLKAYSQLMPKAGDKITLRVVHCLRKRPHKDSVTNDGICR